MSYHQTTLTLPAYARGIHIITPKVEEAIFQLLPHSTKIGLVNLFLLHTSASLAINENADPDVRLDTEDWLNKIAPEDQPEYRHTLEGSDDLPAHLKSMMLGVSLTIPLVDGELGLGTWQGIYLCEHRNLQEYGGQRKLVITVNT
ncbi:secondary thiamine-phosphate synthase enzyme YjbQ [Psychrobacter sp. APC 3281]|uniref:secondary thiamine-phosphate synthase enzyme YjbQ n=1 Tax=Psychrobacter sp. APC 3281 TaxID=3035190 RepID=UPI0025B38FB8|nr:secondary thiamine-phosphate synthase enzyme YjbQ [Psychrobacter sp. APC 3281]MDN3448295.1 secondary thiamine-phosphate synthase enzyme YjbQ [Psychrobacter sp. APC 3281]